MLKIHKLNNNTGIIIGVCLTFLGISIMSFNYLSKKKNNAFTSMNIKLYENNMPINISGSTKEPTENEVKEEEVRIEEASSSNTNINYAYYIGVLEIPKINLKKGFLDIYSNHNNIGENVTVISPSEYPDIANGNLILAAHSGDGYIAFFRNLYKLVKGDKANLYYKGIKYTYTIKNIYTQPKVGELEIKRNYNRKTLTLITCTENDDTTQTVYILEED